MSDVPERPSGPSEPFGPAPEPPLTGGDLPYVQPAPAPTAVGRRTAIAVAAIIAVVAAGFGVSSLAQGDGAADPQGAVQALFDAIGDEDAIGVMQAITPDERDVLKPAVEGVAGEARRLEVASDDLDLSDISGVELEVEGLELTSSELGDGVAMVDVTGGTISSNVAIDDLPLGPVVREVLDRQDAEVEDTSGREQLEGIKLVALERDGGWGVSLLYSVAEAMRREVDPEPAIPAFGEGVAARGATSPEGAVRELVAAATTLDVRRLIELTADDELAVLHDYGPLILDAMEDSDLDPDDGGVVFDELELEVHDGEDGRKVVEATSYAVSVGDDESGVDITFDGECTEVVSHVWFEETSDDGSFDDGTVDIDIGVGPEPFEGGSYPPEDFDAAPPEPEDMTFESCVGDEESVSPIGVFSSFGTGAAAPRIVVEERDGEWYIAPVRTVVDTILEGLRAVEAKDVRAITRMWSGDAEWLWYGEEFWVDCGVEQPDATASQREGEAALEECYAAEWDEDGGP